ncbi:MOSC domain-containing protein [Comamonas sp. NoAH]|uniref:MOSC domain-containing protein n=1 Tax=Comamonas halotolerans TaxID=3041496 RepID=UPI0024E0C6AB|nr:MOSC N-terminal beta barrel domain-containing protein [Comamonas sp. NoAH]
MTVFSIDQADVTGTIGALWVFPIKSCAGIAVQEAKLLPTGLEWDRAWMVVDPEGVFITQREVAQMALVQPHLDLAAGLLRLSFPGLSDLAVPLKLPFMAQAPQIAVQVWNSQLEAWDMGQQAAQWFSLALQRECRLVRFDPAQQRLSNTKWTGGIKAPNQFADGYPLLVTTSSAFEALNARLQAQGHIAVDGLRFRANIVLDGLAEHEEDFIETVWIEAQEPVAIRLGKPCSRCPIPNIDPRTAQSSPEVGHTIAQYRQDARLNGAITFGMNAVVAQGAGQLLRVGQVVGGQLKFD